MAKQRLDTLLVDRNFCTSRQQAQRFIRAGEVRVNQQVVDKPGTEIETTAEIEVKEKSPYVSRGGEKLVKALEEFGISVEGRICLDGGISTGGFTDCLLQAGAKLVYGVDVGYGQVAWSLRNDERVILKERTNLRYLQPTDLYGELPPPTPPYQEGEIEGVYADLGVVDVSFISLTKILEPLWNLLQAPREVVLLVKPQFEVGRERVGKKGVVRDPKDQADAIAHILQAAQNLGWAYRGLSWSPITGPAGNIEYLLWLGMDSQAQPPDLAAIQEITQSAVSHFPGKS
ncbi:MULTISPECIES: TlyA family RNA methyltransferase [unclassified Coleofasciculus]|uniref:TlyA family RNA methyltransferase n=1 Tax=unclassified Coleofasciculus TaxID=2692782 RepID=UPI00188082A7|nr:MULTISPECIES: TlyA family RNA methyltransferase [unclassified Coleofasciculus]MBE9125984.1 TlyA family RNA methyltransferase [Coleofasciculus sp. LEGE 07081]MBE9151178.1 TlyA family RNA methyltransferase [Coleofasciculus sp. LEGE 07092]